MWKCGSAGRCVLPAPGDAEQFLVAGTVRGGGSVAGTAVEQSRDKKEAGSGPLAKVIVEPVRVRLLFHQLPQPVFSRLVKWPVLFHELLKGGVLDELLRGGQELDDVLRVPSPIQRLRP